MARNFHATKTDRNAQKLESTFTLGVEHIHGIFFVVTKAAARNKQHNHVGTNGGSASFFRCSSELKNPPKKTSIVLCKLSWNIKPRHHGVSALVVLMVHAHDIHGHGILARYFYNGNFLPQVVGASHGKMTNGKPSTPHAIWTDSARCDSQIDRDMDRNHTSRQFIRISWPELRFLLVDSLD